MLVRTKEEIFDYIKDVENLMDRRFQSTDSKRQIDFLVVDEFAALKFLWIRKEFNEVNDSLKRIILMGRCERSLLVLQRIRNICSDGAIRDNLRLELMV